jgi:hypothetical protein
MVDKAPFLNEAHVHDTANEMWKLCGKEGKGERREGKGA